MLGGVLVCAYGALNSAEHKTSALTPRPRGAYREMSDMCPGLAWLSMCPGWPGLAGLARLSMCPGPGLSLGPVLAGLGPGPG